MKQPHLQPTQAQLHHWNDDPFAYGAYTYTPPGAEQARYLLAQPLANRVFWAGEATDDLWFSSVHGAYRTGERAAREIMARVAQKRLQIRVNRSCWIIRRRIVWPQGFQRVPRADTCGWAGA
ncbi:FAD-dependent oxidoreductase [bacterium]|nr:FAD-dependent oxidoreductase [bacterium]